MIRWSSASVSKSSLWACAPLAMSGLCLLMRAEAENGDYLEKLNTAIRQPTNQDQCPSGPSGTAISWSICQRRWFRWVPASCLSSRESHKQSCTYIRSKPASLHRALCRAPDRRSCPDITHCAGPVIVEAILSGSRLVPTPPETCSSAPASRLTSPPMLCGPSEQRPRVCRDSPCGWVCSFLSFDLTLPAGVYALLFPCCCACSYLVLGLIAHIGCSRVQELTCGNLVAAMPSSGAS